MKIVIQRVLSASVEIENKLFNQIDKGLLVFVGFTIGDDLLVINKMIDKLINLRIFEDDNRKMNLSLLDVKGEILSISQFTLYANCQKGRRPSFDEAAKPEFAKPLYDLFNVKLKEKVVVKSGVFGADMKISLINDGPVTIILDSKII